MKRETRNAMNYLRQSVVEFFFVYFDQKTSRKVHNHPELAIPMIKEAMLEGMPTKSRLTIYAAALRDALEYERLRLEAEAAKAL
jgi:hypothetical protein